MKCPYNTNLLTELEADMQDRTLTSSNRHASQIFGLISFKQLVGWRGGTDGWLSAGPSSYCPPPPQSWHAPTISCSKHSCLKASRCLRRPNVSARGMTRHVWWGVARAVVPVQTVLTNPSTPHLTLLCTTPGHSHPPAPTFRFHSTRAGILSFGTDSPEHSHCVSQGQQNCWILSTCWCWLWGGWRMRGWGCGGHGSTCRPSTAADSQQHSSQPKTNSDQQKISLYHIRTHIWKFFSFHCVHDTFTDRRIIMKPLLVAFLQEILSAKP